MTTPRVSPTRLALPVALTLILRRVRSLQPPVRNSRPTGMILDTSGFAIARDQARELSRKDL